MTVAVSDFKWIVLGLRSVIDLGLFIASTVFVLSLVSDFKQHDKLVALTDRKGLKTPLMFDVYYLRPYQHLTDVADFYQRKVLDNVMCGSGTNTGSCTSDEELRELLRTQTGCTADAVPHAPICAQCIDVYAKRFYDKVAALPDKRADSNTQTDVDIVEPLRDELEACIARTGGTRSVHYMFKTTPWVSLMLWNGLALAYTATAFALSAANKFVKDSSERNSKRVQAGTLSEQDIKGQQNYTYAYAWVLVYALAIVVIIMYCVAMSELKNAHEYDLRFSVFQLLFMLCMYPLLHSRNQQAEGHTDKTFTLTFGLYMVSAAPSIAIIMNVLNAWLEYDMLNLSVTVLTTFFMLCMLDDLLSVYWSKQPEADSSSQTEHWYMHMHLTGASLLLLVCFATLALPSPPFGDKLFGNMFFVLFIIFALAYCVAPGVLYENKISDTMGIVVCKEVFEIVFRISAFAVLAHVYTHGVPVAL